MPKGIYNETVLSGIIDFTLKNNSFKIQDKIYKQKMKIYIVLVIK